MKTIEETAEEYANDKSSSSVFKEAHISDFKAGIAFAQRWISIEDELPTTYEYSQYNGKRSEYVIAKDSSDKYYIVRLYIDTIHEYDFVNMHGSYILDITDWRPIELE